MSLFDGWERGEPVNTSGNGSSNRERRRAEAEQDRVLLEAAQQGDRAAFRKLVERHQRRVFAIAYSIVRDENDAKEIAQEVFLKVYRNLDKFKGGSSFFTWLYRIVTNMSIDVTRRAGRRYMEQLDEHKGYETRDGALSPMISRLEGQDPLRVVRRAELAARIQKALEELPSYHASVILMREIEGLSYEEMAQAMGVSKGTIMSRLFHARQKMQRALRDCYEEEVGKARSDERRRGGRA